MFLAKQVSHPPKAPAVACMVGRAFPALVLTLLLGSALTACYRCLTEARFLTTRGVLVETGDGAGADSVGTFGLLLSQRRGMTEDVGISWGFQVPAAEEDVAQVVIREGTDDGQGRILFTLPAWDDPPWVPGAVAPVRYDGPLEDREFFEILLRGEAHVEITVRGREPSHLYAPLEAPQVSPWSDTCT